MLFANPVNVCVADARFFLSVCDEQIQIHVCVQVYFSTKASDTKAALQVLEMWIERQRYRLEHICLERQLFVRNTFPWTCVSLAFTLPLFLLIDHSFAHTGTIWEPLIWTLLGQIKAYELQLSPSGSELARLACNWGKHYLVFMPNTLLSHIKCDIQLQNLILSLSLSLFRNVCLTLSLYPSTSQWWVETYWLLQRDLNLSLPRFQTFYKSRIWL